MQSAKNRKQRMRKSNDTIENQRAVGFASQATENQHYTNHSTNILPAMKQRYKITTALPAFLLLFFAASCSQPIAQAEERSGLMEQIEEIRLRPITPDSVHILLDALWVENAHQMTENEKVSFYNLRAAAYMRAQVFEAAETNYLKALYYLEKLNDGNLGRQAQTMLNIGLMRVQQGLLDEALDTYRQALALLGNDHNETELMLKLYLSKIVIFMHRGETDSALNYIRLMLDIAAQEGLREWEAFALKHIASSFIHLRDFSQAEENLRRAIPIFIEYNNQRMLWLAYHHLATVLFQKDKLEEGLFYAQKSDEIAASAGLPPIGMAVYYERRGQIYLEEGSYADSLAMYYKSLELRRKMQEAGVMGEMKNVIGKVYRRMGDFDTAYSYLDIARSIAQENSLLRLEADVQGNLAVIYASRGDMDNFLTAIEAERRLRQKISNEQNTRALHEIQVRYEREIDQLLLAQKAEDIRRHRIIIYLGAFAGLAIIIFLVYAYFMQRRKTQNTIRIVQQYESFAALKKETEQKNKDAEKTLKQNDAAERLLYDFQQLLESEKIYRRQGLDLDTAAKMLNSNRSYLSYAISQSKHKNFTEFVNSYRIEEAVELIKEQNKGGKYASYTIQAIAEMVGFNSPSSFYAAFKHAVGVTPMEYKKSMKILNS